MAESADREAWAAGHAAAEADARARGLAVEFVPRTPGERPAPIDGVEPVKTIVVQRRDGYVLVLAPLAEQFSWAKLRALLGVNRLSLPDPAGALAATGYARGTISPLGARGDWPVVMDARLSGARIVIGSGSPAAGAIVDADELARAYAATVADLGADS
ncbi:YbaK/EbsC family protein [Leucobacter allii]|uniref:aminoacyl-tRNA deacylase n=1 Tax=Leucobacter allii TaxID=2932247 RepID=UPI001FD5CC32|nr:YbaK/EbsC family protein [Leucobacter allii]UOR02337.1 YbaK/EbsC family protein [Leucobacter allii]